MRGDKHKKFIEATNLIKGGMKLQDALKQTQLGSVTYYALKKAGNSTEKKEMAKPTVMEFTVPNVSSARKIAVLVTNTDDLPHVIGALWPS